MAGCVAILAACSDGGALSPGRADTLRVFAASSLTETFTELGAIFEADHPGVQVTFNFAASSSLAQQIREGAPADVFASADERSMQTVVDEGHAADPSVIARNRLSLLVEPGNPKAIADLDDLADPDVVTVMCAPEAPCGRLAVAALAKASVAVRPSSLEENVKGVVAKVSLGEADAGIVYATDARAAVARAQGLEVEIAGADDPDLQAVYPMAVTTDSASVEAATAWRRLVLGDAGRRVLAAHGFLVP